MWAWLVSFLKQAAAYQHQGTGASTLGALPPDTLPRRCRAVTMDAQC
jgi:hypothetical protein